MNSVTLALIVQTVRNTSEYRYVEDWAAHPVILIRGAFTTISICCSADQHVRFQALHQYKFNRVLEQRQAYSSDLEQFAGL